MGKPIMDDIDDFMATRSVRGKKGSIAASNEASREARADIYKKTGVQMRPEAHIELKKLALELGLKDRECLASALNFLFKKHGKDPVA